MTQSESGSTPDHTISAANLRFPFGRNWAEFLRTLDDDGIRSARESLLRMLDLPDLRGKTFLDAGSGSGLFSLAAMDSGAAAVVSFDYDPDSVACTAELKRRRHPDREDWRILRGDCLEEAFLTTLPEFDVVYCWGVLHHTGDLWRGLGNVQAKVLPDGLLYIALYNDQGLISRIWRGIKRLYNRGPAGRLCVTATFFPLFALIGLVQDLLSMRHPANRYRRPGSRGMSLVRDWYDWLGGYPFEVARPRDVIRFLGDRGYTLRRLSTTSGWGCNEFVFCRSGAPSAPKP